MPRPDPNLRRRATATAALLLAAGVLAAGGCVRVEPARPATVAVATDRPAGFSAALARALPYTVGVYTVRDDAGAAAKRDARDEAFAVADEIELLPDGNIGAGIVLRADGSIATAAHVVARAKRVIVKLADERIVQASVVGIDADTDLALLRVDERWPQEPPLGHSASLRPGDWVVAVGEPFALQRTAVAGIVGGPARHFVEDREVVYIQSDISLNPGHSGGPLIDASGAIVGLNARAIAGPYGMAGMSLTVPIEVVLRVAERLREGRRVEPERFGATFQDLLPTQAFDAGLLRASGAVVQVVRSGGMAAGVGVKRGDIVIGLNGQPVSDSADLARLLLERDASAPLRITVYRDRAYRELRSP